MESFKKVLLCYNCFDFSLLCNLELKLDKKIDDYFALYFSSIKSKTLVDIFQINNDFSLG